MGRDVSMGRPHLLRPLTADRTCWTVGWLSEGIKPKTRRSAMGSSVGLGQVNRRASKAVLVTGHTSQRGWSYERLGEPA